MKKLVFGLIATVMFGFVGNATSNINHRFAINKLINIENNSANIVEENAVVFCFNVYAELNLGSYGDVGVSTTICCARWTVREPRYHCWGVTSTRPTIIAYLDVEALDQNIKDEIAKNKLTKISISKSGVFEFENGTFSIQDGEYIINSDKDGRFLEVVILKK